jgi:hypothetical protein
MTDRQRIRVTHVEHHDDGTTVQHEYEDLPLPPNDPYVRERQRNSAPSDSDSEIITTFAAFDERPPTFPAELPFLPGREVYTTESPDGSMSTGARWRCIDPEAVVASAVAASVADGWAIVPSSPLSLELPQQPAAVLRRGEMTRMCLIVETYGVYIVQLLDVQERVGAR